MPQGKKRRVRPQTEVLKALNQARLRGTLGYAFRLSPIIFQAEAAGMKQREIVHLLNEAGAPVASEYEWKKPPNRPNPMKQWSLVQYQRFRKQVDEACEKMAWWTKHHKWIPHVKPFGNASGLFRYPEVVGLDRSVNHAPRELFQREEPEEALKERLLWPPTQPWEDAVLEEWLKESREEHIRNGGTFVKERGKNGEIIESWVSPPSSKPNPILRPFGEDPVDLLPATIDGVEVKVPSGFATNPEADDLWDIPGWSRSWRHDTKKR